MQMLPQNKKRSKWLLWYGIFLLVALPGWWVWHFWRASTSAVDLPYNAFLEQVKDGNVRAVAITGSQIDGVLARPVSGPVPITGASGQKETALAFRTQFPDKAVDSNLMGLLNTHQVQVTKDLARASWPVPMEQAAPLLAIALLPVVFGIFAVFNSDREGLLRKVKRLNPFHHNPPLAYIIEHPEETLASIAGQGEAVGMLKNMLANNSLPAALLLAGPPGTGKTLLAKALAGERQGTLIVCRAAHLLGPTVTPRRLHRWFQSVQEMAPGVMLIDGLEEAGRGSPAAFEQLLNELDALSAHPGLTLLGETRHPEAVDPALRSTGRFDRAITLQLPDRQGRAAILGLHTRGLRLAGNVNLGIIARTTTGFSGAELAELCVSAARTAQQNGRDQQTMTDFEDALDRLLILSPRGLLNEQDRRAAAYHEAGHALAAWLVPAAVPFKRISILPGASSRSLPLQGEENQGTQAASSGNDDAVFAGPFSTNRSADHYNKEDILAGLSVMLGGRAAEEIATGDVTISAENDLLEATRLARRMVTRWGMGSVGLMVIDQPGKTSSISHSQTGEVMISEETAARIDQDVQSVLSSRYSDVRALLEETRDLLDRLVQALLDEETLDQEQISRVLGPRPLTTPMKIHPSQRLPS